MSLLISKDLLWKAVIEELSTEFLEYFFQDYIDLIDLTRRPEFLDTELQKISRGLRKGKRIADRLMKVWMKDGSEQWFLIHVEVQSQADNTLNHRMFTYYYRILDKYEKELTALVIKNYMGGAPLGIYNREFMGTTIEYRFRTFDTFLSYEQNISNDNNLFSFILQSVYLDIKFAQNDLTLGAEKIKLIKRFLTFKPYSKEKMRVIANFIQDYIRLYDENLEQKIEESIEKVLKNATVMGMDELYQMYIKKAEKIGTKKGYKKGMELGMEKGMEKGIEKGEINALIRTVLRANANGYSLSEICLLTDLSEVEILEILHNHKV